MLKHITPPENENIFAVTKTQLRDMEILVTFNTMKSLGIRRTEAISILMDRYSLSYNAIEKAIYIKTNR